MRKEGILAIILLILIATLIAFVTYHITPKKVLLSPEITSLSSFQPRMQGTWGIEIVAQIKDGEAIINTLFGDGINFLYVAGDDDGTGILRTSNTNTINFDRDTDDYFVASWSSGTESESYLLKIDSITEDTSVHENYTRINNIITGQVVATDKKTGDVVTIGNIELTITEINKDENWVNLTINLGRSFNKTYDILGYYINLPTQDILPLSGYYFEIFNSSDNLVQKYLAYFSNNQATINGSCIDADFGFNYNIASYASEGSSIVNDNCISTSLLNESYCDSGNIKTQIYNCSLNSNECQNNVCNCIPNWQTNQTSCTQDDAIITYYRDSNNCGQVPAQNETSPCDYDNNGIIGNFTNLNQTNIALQVYINGSMANISETFNTLREIEFREGSLTRVEFNYDFSSPLNIKNIEIIKQPASSEIGYLIIKEIEAEKTLTIDKINSESWKVCVKDSEVDNIDDFTDKCTSSNEYPVSCPGNLSGFTCDIVDDKFIVTGLDHSAVKELINITSSISEPVNCTSNWLCSNWTSCITNQQTRTCIDTNNCSTPSIPQPSLTQACISCTPNWDCGNWSECVSGVQTKTCTDTNSCGTTTGKPATSQTCEKGEIDWVFWIVISILIIAIIAVSIAIIYLWNKKQQTSFNNSKSPFKIQSSNNSISN